MQIDPVTTSYVDVYQHADNKFAIYLRDASRNDQTMFVADSIHADYVPYHVKTGKVKWINAIPGKTIVNSGLLPWRFGPSICENPEIISNHANHLKSGQIVRFFVFIDSL